LPLIGGRDITTIGRLDVITVVDAKVDAGAR
jgi:hypothetical protein